jgi:hypothetical protein
MDTILGRLQNSYEAIRAKNNRSELLERFLDSGRLVQEKRDLALRFSVPEGL